MQRLSTLCGASIPTLLRARGNRGSLSAACAYCTSSINNTRLSLHPHVRHSALDGNALSGKLPSSMCYVLNAKLSTCSMGPANFSCPSDCASEVGVRKWAPNGVKHEHGNNKTRQRHTHAWGRMGLAD
jgi:hypothetical protein